MESVSYKASAPGSAMIFGEHAVLHGRPAIVAALDCRLRVEVTPRKDRIVLIESGDHSYEGLLDELPVEPPLRFVLAAIASLREALPSGFVLRVTSSFPPDRGLGSSAAVTVATLAALGKWGGRGNEPAALMRRARDVVLEVQGVGSGADVAASVYGGVLRVQQRTSRVEVERLTEIIPLVLVYCGYKMPTVEVIARVEKRRRQNPEKIDVLWDRIGEAAERGASYIRQGDWMALGPILREAQQAMDALELNTPELAAILEALRCQPKMVGAKISGSGLGDCVVGIGRIDEWTGPGEWLPVVGSSLGVEDV